MKADLPVAGDVKESPDDQWGIPDYLVFCVLLHLRRQAEQASGHVKHGFEEADILAVLGEHGLYSGMVSRSLRQLVESQIVWQPEAGRYDLRSTAVALAVRRGWRIVENFRTPVYDFPEEVEESFFSFIDEVRDIPDEYGELADNTGLSRLDRGHELYRRTVGSLRELRDTLASANDTRVISDQEKQQILVELDASIVLLQGRVVNKNVIKGLLLGTLSYIAGKFADAPIGELAQECWELVKSLIGL